MRDKDSIVVDDAYKPTKAVDLPSVIHLSKEMVGRRSLLEIGSGWLVGFDAGEFGGGLWWFAHDGKKNVELSERNVHALYMLQGKPVALIGLDHMGYDKGSVIEIIENGGPIHTKELADLDGSPEASTIGPDNDLLVATPTSVLRVSANGKIVKLYQGNKISVENGKIQISADTGDMFIYPTSIAVDAGGDVFVGMRFFLFKVPYEKSTTAPQFFMQSRCSHYTTKKYICTCDGK